jgi:hypothetical protein
MADMTQHDARSTGQTTASSEQPANPHACVHCGSRFPSLDDLADHHYFCNGPFNCLCNMDQKLF